MQERSSAGRASVSKTEGRGFESLRSCQNIQFPRDLWIILAASVLAFREKAHYGAFIPKSGFVLPRTDGQRTHGLQRTKGSGYGQAQPG